MIKRIFFPILLLVLFGCSDKDDDVVTEQLLEINSTNISGKWNYKGGRFNGGSYEGYSHSCSSSKDNMDLQPSNILVYNNFMGGCQITSSESTTWNLTGDKLELGGRQGSIVPIVYFYVVKITNNELVLNEVAGPDSPNNQNGYGALHYYTRN